MFGIIITNMEKEKKGFNKIYYQTILAQL